MEDACRLSDVGGRPYIPPRAAVYLAQRSPGRQVPDQELQPETLGGAVKCQLEDVGENELTESLEGEDTAGDKATSSPKTGCLKQKGVIMPPVLPQQKRVAFDIPLSSGPPSEVGESTDGADLSDEKRRLGDGAQSSEHMAEDSCDGLKGVQALGNGKIPAMDDNVVKPKLRMRHSSLPESQQCLAHKSSRFASLKALKRFVMSRHSKSVLKKKVNESAVISLVPNKVITGGSAVQSSTTFQRSISFRGQKSSLSSSSDGMPDVPVQRGGRHSSEVLSSRPSLGSFIRGLPEKIRGRAVGSDGRSTSGESSTKDEASPVRLPPSPSPCSPTSSDSSESKQRRTVSPEQQDLDRRRESLVSGEDGAESVESPSESDKAHEEQQVDGFINGAGAIEQHLGLKTASELSSMEQKYQHKLQAVERECEARATAKEVQLHAKIRELEEQLVASNW